MIALVVRAVNQIGCEDGGKGQVTSARTVNPGRKTLGCRMESVDLMIRANGRRTRKRARGRSQSS
jgi:hypothetical protein